MLDAASDINSDFNTGKVVTQQILVSRFLCLGGW